MLLLLFIKLCLAHTITLNQGLENVNTKIGRGFSDRFDDPLWRTR